MDLYENPDPQTIAAYLELLRIKSTDAKIRSHDDKLTRNRSTLSRSGRSVRGVSLSPVLGPEVIALPWPTHRDSSSTDPVNDFDEPTGNIHTLIADDVPPQKEQPQSETGERSSGSCTYLPLANAGALSVISAGLSRGREAPAERPLASDIVVSSFSLEPDAVATAMTQARDDPQLRRSANMAKLYSPRSRAVEPDVSLRIGGDEPLADPAPPRQGRPRSHSMKSDTSRSTEVDHVLSIFGGKKGSKQLLQLESDEAQYYADILDEVRYSIKLHTAPADLTLRPGSKQENTAQSNADKAVEVFAETLRNLWDPSIVVHPHGHI